MQAFDNVAFNDNKYQILIENYYLVPPRQESLIGLSSEAAAQENEYSAYRECKLPTIEPHIATWEYLSKDDVKTLIEFQKNRQIRKFILDKLDKTPKGIPRIVVRELMYTVTKFCKNSNFTLEQTGAVLSQFYLTHIYFTSCLYLGPEKLYNYFKELQLCHSLPFPPRNIKLFNLEQTKSIMIYFCRLYLRNMPILRVMCLPNFTLRASYHLEPEVALGKKKKDGKKTKKGKTKTGKKKK